MNKLSDLIKQQKMKIDDDWLNNEKPVVIKSGNKVKISNIDRSQVPNVIYGKVNYENDEFDFTWSDSGQCLKATDGFGTPRKPTDDDNLIKFFDNN